MSSDTHEIVPDGVDLEELQRRKNDRVPNGDEASDRCPECGYAKLTTRVSRYETNDGDYYCRRCREHIDEPVVAVSIQAALETQQ
jgi:predicted SprT family Zn-dependent metalloprotease